MQGTCKVVCFVSQVGTTKQSATITVELDLLRATGIEWFHVRISPRTVFMLWLSASRYAVCRIPMSLRIIFQGRVDFKGSAMPLTVVYETYIIMWCNFTKYWLSLIYVALILVWNVWNSCNIRFFTRKCSVCWIFSIEWVNSDGLLCLW